MNFKFPPFTRTKQEVIDQGFFTMVNGEVYMAGKPLPEDVKERLSVNAQHFIESELWGILKTSLEQEAIDLALRRSETWEQVQSAKMLAHALNRIDKFVLALSQK